MALGGDYAQQYSILFEDVCDENEKVGGPAALTLFSACGIARATLGDIWDIADRDKKGVLDRNAFYVALKLIARVQDSLPLPSSSPGTQCDVPLPLFNGAQYPGLDPVGGGTPTSAPRISMLRSGSSTSSDVFELSENEDYREASDDEDRRPRVQSVRVEALGRKGSGMKKFTEYLVVSSPGNMSVSRRYSDFEWLRSRLVVAYPYRLIPPLPPKSAVHRFEEDFLEDRRAGMQRFLRTLLKREVFRDSSDIESFILEDAQGLERLRKEKAPLCESEANPKARDPLKRLPAHVEEHLESVRRELATYTESLDASLVQFHNLARARAEHADALQGVNEGIGGMLRGEVSKREATSEPHNSGQLTWSVSPDEALCTTGFKTCDMCMVIHTDLCQVQKTQQSVAELYTRQHTFERSSMADVMQDLHDCAQALLDALQASKGPQRDLAAAIKKCDSVKSKLAKEKAKPKSNPKEIDKLDAAIMQEEDKCHEREMKLQFAQWCLVQETSFYHKYRVARSRRMLRRLADSQASFYKTASMAWKCLEMEPT